jgi:hypothetical protein
VQPLLFRQFTQVQEAVECTILHEMVHWSYKVNGNDDEAKKYSGDEEYGTRHFELEAYGHDATLPLNVCKTPYLGILEVGPGD